VRTVLPFVALGYFAAGLMAGVLLFVSLGGWVWRYAFEVAHENLVCILEKRGQIERALHVRASLALFQARWREEKEP
jgi:hypothetical protein